MKLKLIPIGLLLASSQYSFAYEEPEYIGDYGDRDQVCETKYRDITVYYGNASCTVIAEDIYTKQRSYVKLEQYFPESNNNQFEIIAKRVGHNWQQVSSLGQRPLPPPSLLECSAQIPGHVRQQESGEECKWVPREPYTTYLTYEFGACSNSARLGIVNWSSIQGATYQLYRSDGTKVYEGTSTNASFNSTSFGFSTLKVRALKNGKVGSFRYLNTNIPECGPGGVEPM